MKKIININFHGRVVPIEETAYDILKQYIESLRKHFANEEGRDEIINDIENRFAELFSERLQKGSTCITDEDVNAIILSMGRPEDFEQDEMSASSASTGSSSSGTSSQSSSQQSYIPEEPHRLYRSENDKILGGVCGGLAAYLRIDPAIVRIIFALISFGGFGAGILLYIVLWIAVPSKSITTNIRKRLYRNPDNRVLAGVASGLAAYFHIDVWVPRLIFALPLILGIVTSIFRNAWFDFDPTPVFVTGGFGGTLFITYIILWIVLPEATTASEKLEMRGEKVDLESIKNTIKSDLEGFKGRATQVSAEVRDRAQQFGQEMKQATRNFASETAPMVRKTGTGFGHAIGVLFKAFFLFIAGIIAFALIMVLIGLLFSGAGFFPFRNYLLSGFWQNFLAWSSLVLFLCIPAIALLTWLIRRIMGVHSKNNYLGYAFGSLWVIGLISFIIFASMLLNNFRTKASVDDNINLIQPASGKIVISVADEKVNYYGSDWFGFHWDGDAPFYSISEDSVVMNTVRVSITKSKDSAFHVHRVKFSHGNTPGIAQDLAGQIQFNPKQTDSILYLPPGFTITPRQKFRNQQVLVVVEIPVGKRIYIDRSVEDYHWFSININRRHRGWNFDWDDQWDNSYSWESNVDYIMTNHGIERTDEKIKSSEDGGDENKNQESDNRYHYKNKTDSSKHKKAKDTTKIKTTALIVIEEPVTVKNKKSFSITKEWDSASGNKSLKNDDKENLYSPFDILSKMM
ncbi:MAG: PspC domain-containing protein [Bacteroidetes bacterium]|nr:PspC domain-containing protein [Bacteroidota bacterium]